jgi:hypothetical protein
MHKILELLALAASPTPIMPLAVAQRFFNDLYDSNF